MRNLIFDTGPHKEEEASKEKVCTLIITTCCSFWSSHSGMNKGFFPLKEEESIGFSRKLECSKERLGGASLFATSEASKRKIASSIIGMNTMSVLEAMQSAMASEHAAPALTRPALLGVCGLVPMPEPDQRNKAVSRNNHIHNHATQNLL